MYIMESMVRALRVENLNTIYYLSNSWKARRWPVTVQASLTCGKCIFTIENVTQYNRNVNLPRVNVSRVKHGLRGLIS